MQIHLEVKGMALAASYPDEGPVHLLSAPLAKFGITRPQADDASSQYHISKQGGGLSGMGSRHTCRHGNRVYYT